MTLISDGEPEVHVISFSNGYSLVITKRIRRHAMRQYPHSDKSVSVTKVLTYVMKNELHNTQIEIAKEHVPALVGEHTINQETYTAILDEVFAFEDKED